MLTISNLSSMQNKIKTLLQRLPNKGGFLCKSFLTIGLLTGLTACATRGDVQSESERERALKPGYARIEFQAADRFPNIFKEKLFGRFSSLNTESGINVEFTPENSDQTKRFVDVMPGTYGIKADCDPVKNYSGDQINWLTNHEITVQADQIIKFGCEYYTKTINYGGDSRLSEKSAWPDKKSDLDRKVRRVRLHEIDSRFVR